MDRRFFRFALAWNGKDNLEFYSFALLRRGTGESYWELGIGYILLYRIGLFYADEGEQEVWRDVDTVAPGDGLFEFEEVGCDLGLKWTFSTGCAMNPLQGAGNGTNRGD